MTIGEDILKAQMAGLEAELSRGGPWSAELADEQEPNGMVLLRDARGAVRLMMSRKSWEWFRADRKADGLYNEG